MTLYRMRQVLTKFLYCRSKQCKNTVPNSCDGCPYDYSYRELCEALSKAVEMAEAAERLEDDGK